MHCVLHLAGRICTRGGSDSARMEFGVRDGNEHLISLDIREDRRRSIANIASI
jgi:hypothetical protein